MVVSGKFQAKKQYDQLFDDPEIMLKWMQHYGNLR